RTKYLLGKSRDRAHVLVGLAVAVANIDEMIRLIRSAPSPAVAREQMMARDWPARDSGALGELLARPPPPPRPRRTARADAAPRLAGAGHRAAGRFDRRPTPQAHRGNHQAQR